jgi:Ni,Fe-hydrogenase III large subunit
MSQEFAKMLNETLEKMQSRIKQVNWDNEADPAMMKRLKEIAGLNN